MGSVQFTLNTDGLKADVAEGETESVAFLQAGTLINSLTLASFTPADTSEFD